MQPTLSVFSLCRSLVQVRYTALAINPDYSACPSSAVRSKMSCASVDPRCGLAAQKIQKPSAWSLRRHPRGMAWSGAESGPSEASPARASGCQALRDGEVRAASQYLYTNVDRSL